MPNATESHRGLKSSAQRATRHGDLVIRPGPRRRWTPSERHYGSRVSISTSVSEFPMAPFGIPTWDRGHGRELLEGVSA
jgi:hypothetical protein